MEMSAFDKWKRKSKSNIDKENRRRGLGSIHVHEKLAQAIREPTACSLQAPGRVLLELSPVPPGRRPKCQLQITGPGGKFSTSRRREDTTKDRGLSWVCLSAPGEHGLQQTWTHILHFQSAHLKGVCGPLI